ncbi:hypothetical protein L1887_60626 [Cichorium endivia]|nr:hypothetical protein L1887_60626 [Cichorium endivia]
MLAHRDRKVGGGSDVELGSEPRGRRSAKRQIQPARVERDKAWRQRRWSQTGSDAAADAIGCDDATWWDGRDRVGHRRSRLNPGLADGRISSTSRAEPTLLALEPKVGLIRLASRLGLSRSIRAFSCRARLRTSGHHPNRAHPPPKHTQNSLLLGQNNEPSRPHTPSAEKMATSTWQAL